MFEVPQLIWTCAPSLPGLALLRLALEDRLVCRTGNSVLMTHLGNRRNLTIADGCIVVLPNLPTVPRCSKMVWQNVPMVSMAEAFAMAELWLGWLSNTEG